MAGTQLLMFHPDFARSKANRTLAEAARTCPDVEVVDVHALYPDGRIDVETEVRQLLGAERLILQFPVRWYSTPALLQEWQDQVLTRMMYVNPTEGERLRGMPLLVAATAGNTPEAYSPTGINLFPLEDLLRPLQAMASRCALQWTPPFIVHRADRRPAVELAAEADRYAERIREWSSASASTPLPA